MALLTDGIAVLPRLYHFDLPPPLGRITRGGNFKTKAQVDPVQGTEFLPLVEAYYGRPPVSITGELIISWPVSDMPFGSQLWHRDTEGGAKQLRAMCYLSDVTENDGPFCYVPGTMGLDLGSNRLSDVEFERVVPRERWVTYTGPRGTVILFDTMGFHRGLPNVSGKREALCFTYRL